jgi:hypothetical protein
MRDLTEGKFLKPKIAFNILINHIKEEIADAHLNKKAEIEKYCIVQFEFFSYVVKGFITTKTHDEIIRQDVKESITNLNTMRRRLPSGKNGNKSNIREFYSLDILHRNIMIFFNTYKNDTITLKNAWVGLNIFALFCESKASNFINIKKDGVIVVDLSNAMEKIKNPKPHYDILHESNALFGSFMRDFGIDLKKECFTNKEEMVESGNIYPFFRYDSYKGLTNFAFSENDREQRTIEKIDDEVHFNSNINTSTLKHTDFLRKNLEILEKMDKLITPQLQGKAKGR